MKAKVEILRPFGPKIFKAQLPDGVIDIMLKITDNLILDKKKESYGCALAGQIEEEVKISNELLEKNKVYNFFNSYLRSYVLHCLTEMGKFDEEKHELKTAIVSMWFNEMKANEYNPAHFHTQCFVSSVFYLKKPGKRIKRNIECKEDKDGKIEFIDRSVAPDFLTMGSILAKPDIGTMFIWPSSLLHTVYPFLGDEVRRSVAWNGTYQLIDKETNTVISGVLNEKTMKLN